MASCHIWWIHGLAIDSDASLAIVKVRFDALHANFHCLSLHMHDSMVFAVRGAPSLRWEVPKRAAACRSAIPHDLLPYEGAIPRGSGGPVQKFLLPAISGLLVGCYPPESVSTCLIKIAVYMTLEHVHVGP
jgi:hypothetical protein